MVGTMNEHKHEGYSKQNPGPILVLGSNKLILVVLGRLKGNTGVHLSPPSGRLRTTPPKRITDKDRARAVELYLTGLSLRQVSEQVGVSRHVVKAAVEKAGHGIRPKKTRND